MAISEPLLLIRARYLKRQGIRTVLALNLFWLLLEVGLLMLAAWWLP